MKKCKAFLQSIFPFPPNIQQLLEAQAFLIISSSAVDKPHRQQPKLIKYFQYESQKEANQALIKFFSLSTLFYLQIFKTTIKHIAKKNRWCVVIQMQSPKISIKQKINMLKNESKFLAQNHLIMILNGMNTFYNKYLNPQLINQNQSSISITANRLIGNIFFMENQVIKLFLPEMMYSESNKIKNNFPSQGKSSCEDKNKNQKQILKFSLFLIKTLTIKDEELILSDLKATKNSLSNLKFQHFCLKQFKSYLIQKMNFFLDLKQSSAKIKELSKITTEISPEFNQQNFPNLKFSKPSHFQKIQHEHSTINNTVNSLISQTKQLSKKNSLSQIGKKYFGLRQGQNIQEQKSYNKKSLPLSSQPATLKVTTLNELVHDKIVESFQQDEYSYILESAQTSPSRISPYKGSISRGLGFSHVSEKVQNQKEGSYVSKFSPTSFLESSTQTVIPEQLSSSQYLEQVSSLTQEESTNIHNKRSRSNSHASYLQDTNSIILQVQEESNYCNDLIEGSSQLCSDMIELSLSRGIDQDDERSALNQKNNAQSVQNLTIEVVDENQGTHYYGETVNGLKQGKGKIIYHDGGFYQGEWKNNNINGFGRLFYPSNKLAYAGYWLNGCFHGPGLVLNQIIELIPAQNPINYADLSNLGRTWTSYRGNFNLDVRQGFGMVKLSNGDIISGLWQENCLNGQGQYKRKDGSFIKGIWNMNKLSQILMKTQNFE